MVSNILVQGFCPLKIKITQFPDGFDVNKKMHLTHHINKRYVQKHSSCEC